MCTKQAAMLKLKDFAIIKTVKKYPPAKYYFWQWRRNSINNLNFIKW